MNFKIIFTHFFVVFLFTIPLIHSEHDQKAFKRPIITLTFDDAWDSQFTHALPLLKKYQFPGVFYVYTEGIGQKNKMTANQIIALKSQGHEIGAHSVTHRDLTTLTEKEVEWELSTSKQTLENLLHSPVNNFATPFGKKSPLVLETIKRFFLSNRVVGNINSPKNFDPYSLLAYGIDQGTPQLIFERLFDLVKSKHLWLILVYHQVDNNGGPWSITAENFEKHLEAIKKRSLPVLTVDQALSEILPQLQQSM